MKYLYALPWISGVMALTAADSGDLLRFSNGDQLHGDFQGFKPGPQAVWLREDVTAPVEFKTSQLRHIVLNNGKPLKSLSSLSYVALVNGDRVPGLITSVDEKTVTLTTTYAGTLAIPREQVSMLAPSPLGGRLNYHGPFNEDEWKMSHAAFPDGMPAAQEAADAKDKDKSSPSQPGRWKFSGSAWYWPGKQSGTALLRENTMQDRSILRFDLAWKNRLSLAVAFHADFAKPKAQDADDKNQKLQALQARRQVGFVSGDSNMFPMLFGNSYVIQLFSTHLMLYRSTISEDGVPSVERIQINGNTIRLGETGKAKIEIRSNRQTGEISLFVDDEFVVQWGEGATGPRDQIQFAGKGAGFGFLTQTDDSPVRISDVMVAEWNGMPDSARSLQVDDQDIVLLANGTDRFSGKVSSLQDGKLGLEGKYGQFQFRLDDIAEVRFARSRLAKESEPAADNLIVRLSPLGQISGRPLSGDASSIRIQSPVCGDMNLNLESGVMLDFQQSNNISDAWDDNF